MSEWVEAAYLAAAGGLGSLVTHLFNRRGTKAIVDQTEHETAHIDASAAQIIADTALALVAPVKQEIEGLTARVAVLEAEKVKTTATLQTALTYIRVLLSWISTHIPDQPPQPPADLMV